MMSSFGSLLATLGWVILWFVGGWWIARRVFTLSTNEEWVVGAGIGLVLETWFANLLPRIIPTPLSFWISAVVVFVIGLLVWVPFNKDFFQAFHIRVSFPLVLSLIVIVYSFTMIGRGLGLFDDYQNLPIVSRLAMGDIPPHFPLNSNIRFSYHYLLLLFSGQISRLAEIGPWLSNDVARAIVFGMGIIMVGMVAYRLTSNKMIGFFSAIFVSFTMGTRWLLLFLPPTLTQAMFRDIPLIDSSVATASNFYEGLIRPLQVGGSGPLPFPFAFMTGINSPGILSHSGIGFIHFVVLGILLLTFSRWKDWKSAAITTILIAALGLIEEVSTVLIVACLFIFILLYVIIQKPKNQPWRTYSWLILLPISTLLILFQGGVISEIFYRFVHPGLTITSYYVDYLFTFAFPPVLVSQGIGALNLFNPSQLLLALMDFGPIFLIIPFATYYGVRSYKSKRWFETALVFSSLFSLILGMFVVTGGTVGISATTRFYETPIRMLKFFGVPLLFLWLAKKNSLSKIFTWGLVGISMIGGIVMFGVESIAVQRPVYSDFIDELDVKMFELYWNKLDPNALVFDSNPNRSATIFGRFTNSSTSWYSVNSDFSELLSEPDPYALRKNGYGYVYIENTYWDSLSNISQAKFQSSCVVLAREVITSHGWYRKLLDIRSCIQ